MEHLNKVVNLGAQNKQRFNVDHESNFSGTRIRTFKGLTLLRAKIVSKKKHSLSSVQISDSEMLVSTFLHHHRRETMTSRKLNEPQADSLTDSSLSLASSTV